MDADGAGLDGDEYYSEIDIVETLIPELSTWILEWNKIFSLLKNKQNWLTLK